MDRQLISQPETAVALPISQRFDQSPAAIYIAGLRPSSRRTMGEALVIVARILSGIEQELDAAGKKVSLARSKLHLSFPWHNLRSRHIQLLRSELEARYAYTTANRIMSAVRMVLKEAWRLDLLSAEDYHKAVDTKPVPGATIPAGRSIPQAELTALLETCDNSKAGIRDAAMISVLYVCGLRRAELVKLDIEDYEDGKLLVQGKGNKERIVPVEEDAQRAIADWLAVRLYDGGPLFTGVGNRNNGRRLSSQAVYAILEARAKAAGIPDVSPHDLRRTFVGDLLDAGVDIATVQKLAGHANVDTTSRYDRRGEEVKKAAVAKLRLPYRHRTLHVDNDSK